MNKELYFELGLGTRMRRLIELFTASGERLYADKNVAIKVGHFYAIYAVAQRGPQTINDIAEAAGFSHSAVSQTVKKLVNLGIFDTHATNDARQKNVVLTAKGQQIISTLGPTWNAIEEAMKDAIAETGIDFMDSLTRLEQALGKTSLYDRVQAKLTTPSRAHAFEIKPYDNKWRQAFHDLNMRWLNEYFEVEPLDTVLLSDPESTILNEGGEIFFAVSNNAVHGTVAMKRKNTGVFELTKLAVDPDVQQGGMGKALCKKVIERFVARGGTTLFLETNTILAPALKLYEKLGFIEKPNPYSSPYSRSNHYMEWINPKLGAQHG
ncbi:bifunctional helix-turn-helix transcriptional regulator/GNAT family N-acetyltransferase [Kordiimonas aquimaris]|uniref:bifunctional helix-turn-helix transcriptional regulator/GNAT family N-acetyltransferase n=1 Tax=Kordiimonas aquimaris TaxID=707591 RepID=UPI0021D2DEBC|nr:helix-turn-helix domain-containing GNAT family N-acetyltransferase [Kordiimonas aquimaris]